MTRVTPIRPQDVEAISRAEAKRRGLKRYFTNVMCPAGHLAERYTSSRSCCECTARTVKAWREWGRAPESSL